MNLVIGTTFSVSGLNVALNTIVFFLVYFAGVLAALGVRNLLKLQLKKNGRAPILYESESRLNRAITFIKSVRYCESPTKFLIIFIASFLLLIFEISAESGVDSSSLCTPRIEKTYVGLCANEFNGDSSQAKKIASALYTQQVGWDEEKIADAIVRQGFRKNFDGREAFGVPYKNKSLPIVVRNCSVSERQVIAPLQARLTFQNTVAVWALRLTSIYLEKEHVELPGAGDVASNTKYYSAFLVANATGGRGKRIRATFFEYGDSTHVNNVLVAVYRSGDIHAPMVVRNRGKMVKYTLSCAQNVLSAVDFQLAVQVYRSTQLQSSVKEHPMGRISIGLQNVSAPNPLTAADLVKATLGLKATDIEDCIGETAVYTDCGVYDLLYLTPVLFVVGLLGVIVLWTKWLMRKRGVRMQIPTTAKAWSRFVWREIKRQAHAGGAYEKGKMNIADDEREDMRDQPEFFMTTTLDNQQVIGLRRRP